MTIASWSKYRDNGIEISYTAKELNIPAGYHVSYSEDTFIFHNTYVPETTSVYVNKVWNDNDDELGMRPGSITVFVYADLENNQFDPSKVVSTVTLNGDNNWAYEVKNLPKYRDNGTEIKYSVGEIQVEHYITEHEVEGTNHFTIINTYNGETVTIEGMKTWDDDDDREGVRPESIKVNLLADGKIYKTMNVSGQIKWEYKFIDLPVYMNRNKVVYTITEEPVSNYETIIEGFDITNKYQKNSTELSVIKVWHDNVEEGHPEVAIQLLLNDEPYERITLNESNNWMHTWSGLPAEGDGKESRWSVLEEKVPEQYSVSYDFNENTKLFTVTNSFLNDTGLDEDRDTGTNDSVNTEEDDVIVPPSAPGSKNISMVSGTMQTQGAKTDDNTNIIVYAFALAASVAILIMRKRKKT